jgi:hypothetical protein
MNSEAKPSTPMSAPAETGVVPARDLVFVSHATPEDNEFSRWLTLQLNRCGHKAWCDLTKLLGGEKWWTDISEAISVYSIKFLFVASKTSVKKPGVIRELKIALETAKSLKRFVIPLRFDDVPYRDFPEGIGSELNAVDFSTGWKVGLDKLLQRFKEDAVQVASSMSMDAVAEYWRSQHRADEGLEAKPEVCWSNWFPITELPDDVFVHCTSGMWSKKFSVRELRFPAEEHNRRIVSFASREDLEGCLRLHGIRITKSEPIATMDFRNSGSKDHFIKGREARNFLISLLREAWVRAATARGFREYTLANDNVCHWVEKDTLKNDESKFVAMDGRTRARALVGIKNFRAADGEITRQRFWHFAVQARVYLYPVPVVAMRMHVVFSDDGKTPIDSDAKQHSARRSQCKQWWNDDWRDRLLASMAALASCKEGPIILPLGGTFQAEISTHPLIFESPVSYVPVVIIGHEDLPDDAEDWEAEETAVPEALP